MYDVLKKVWVEMTGPGGAFEIEEIDVRGFPMRTFKAAPPSLREVWLSSLAFAERPYLVFDDETLTYGETHDRVNRMAAWMRASGLKPGDRVAIALRNFPEWMQCYWAVVSSGLTVVGMNAWWVEDEMDYALKDASPKLLFADEERLARFEGLREHYPDLPVVGIRCEARDWVTPFESIMQSEPSLPDLVIDPDSDACIFYTSGTTGRPKGAQQTHRGCVHNILNMGFWSGCLAQTMHLVKGTPLPDPTTAPPGSALVTTPLFHVTANNCVVQPTTLTGGKIIHMYKWDAGEALKLIESEKITGISGVPVMSREIISHPDFDKYDTSTLTALGGGGAQLQPDLVGKINKALPNGKAATGYGMTETCGIISAVSGDFFVDRPDSCGPVVPTLDAKVVDEAGNDLPAGQLGELCVKGGNVIKGYLNREEATAESIQQGWLRTGDIARQDEDGFIYLVDRAKDMVLRGGENIYCAEVESAVFKLDGVAECTVFGVADDRLGEEVGIAIVPAANVTLTAQDIRDHCSQLIAKFKIPRYIWLRSESLPRNASGKFLKRELRDSLNPADAE